MDFVSRESIAEVIAAAQAQELVAAPVQVVQATTGTIDHCTIPATSDEDFVVTFRKEGTGIAGDRGPCIVLALFDGHGKKCERIEGLRCLTLIKEAPLEQLLMEPKPAEAMVEYLKEKNYQYNQLTGATMAMARIYPTGGLIETFCVGDSKAVVWMNGEMVYENVEHISTNRDELARIRQLHGEVRYEQPIGNRQETLSPDEITMIPSPYIVFPGNIPLAPTQSLGHFGRTGCKPCEGIVHFDPVRDVVQVAVYSDGVGDVTSLHCPEDRTLIGTQSATTIAETAYQRWLQEWKYYGYARGMQVKQPRAETWAADREEIMLGITPTIGPFPPSCRDDIGVATWTNRLIDTGADAGKVADA